MATVVTDKKKFLELMNKGWEKSRYTSGSYIVRKKGHAYCCAMGAAALGAGVYPGELYINFSNSNVYESAIIRANDKAGSKRAARAAVTKLLS